MTGQNLKAELDALITEGVAINVFQAEEALLQTNVFIFQYGGPYNVGSWIFLEAANSGVVAKLALDGGRCTEGA